MVSESVPPQSEEDVLDEFVEILNARDLEGVAELLAPEVTSTVFGGGTPETVVEGMSDLLLRYPHLVTSRGEVGEEPVVVLWLPDEEERYRAVGYLDFAFEGGLIEHLEYVDEVPSDLLAEEPEGDELAEWDRWPGWDSGEGDRA